MTFITYKRFGNKEYAYKLTSYWDKKARQPRHKSEYLGVVIDRKKGVFRKTLKDRLLKEELILDFGDTFLLQEFLKKEGFTKLLRDTFGDKADTVLSLICYKLCHPSAMRLAETWQSGNVIRHLCKADLASQRISDLMVDIGDEDVYREFFENYLRFVKHSSDGLILDITAMPNQVHMPLSQWGYHDEDIDKQVNLMLVVDKASALPLFFRYMPGSVSDVSALKPTIAELKRLGVENTFSIFDAGFYSEGNINALQGQGIGFMVRLPSNRTIYRELIEKSGNLEGWDNAVEYGERALFVSKHRINLYGEGAFAYVVLDPERKGRETAKLIRGADEIDEGKKDAFALKKRGIMVLVSSADLGKADVVPLYYNRQTAEQLFKFSKDDLEMLPLRVHKEESLRGYLLLIFMTLSAFLLLKKKLGKKVTVEEALMLMRNLKVKVFKDEMLVPEIVKKQRLLLEGLGIIVPKVLGI